MIDSKGLGVAKAVAKFVTLDQLWKVIFTAKEQTNQETANFTLRLRYVSLVI